MLKKFVVLTLLALLVALPARAQPFLNYKVTSAAAGSVIGCTSPPGCNLFSWQVRSGAAAGFLLIIPQATVPADGAVTPTVCVDVPANSSVAFEYRSPLGFPVGMVAVFSTTGCFTKTISATAFIMVAAQ